MDHSTWVHVNKLSERCQFEPLDQSSVFDMVRITALSQLTEWHCISAWITPQ